MPGQRGFQAMGLECLLLRRQGLPGLDTFRLRLAQAQHLAFGDVGQFAHVARPVMAQQLPQLRPVEGHGLAAQAFGGYLGKVVEQQWDIFAAFA